MKRRDRQRSKVFFLCLLDFFVCFLFLCLCFLVFCLFVLIHLFVFLFLIFYFTFLFLFKFSFVGGGAIRMTAAVEGLEREWDWGAGCESPKESIKPYT